MELSDRLRQVLADHELSQASVAEKLGVSPSTVSGWIIGSSSCSEYHLTRIVMDLVPDGDTDRQYGVTNDAKQALLAELFRLRQRARLTEDEKGKWSPELRNHALAAWSRVRAVPSDSVPARVARNRTLVDFPDAFYPLTVISGDKREDSESRINLADFGAVSASPAESRWISKLGLRSDVEFLTDKVFVLEDPDQLKERFKDRNLLVIGSPGSNHLARRCHLAEPIPGWRKAVPIFRFNVAQSTLQEIENLLGTLKGLNTKELVGMQGNQETERQVKHWLKFLFTGGVVDPSYPYWLRAVALPPNLDFGLITLARNPFADDDKVVAILVAGFHMFGTAHAIRMLSDRRLFETHPLGGVLRVAMDQGAGFAVRFDRSEAAWDTDGNYTVGELVAGLEKLAQGPPPQITLPAKEFAQTLAFVKAL